MQSPTASLTFGGISAIDPTTEKVAITFGEKNAQAFFDIKCRNVLWLPENIKIKEVGPLIDSNIELLDKMKEIWLDLNFFPQIASEFTRRLSSGRIAAIKYPAPYLTADHILRGSKRLGLAPLGKKALHEAIANAKPETVEGIFSAKDIESDIFDLYDNGEKEGMSLDMDCFRTGSGRDMLKLHKGTTISIAGIPGSGKSRFAKFMMVRLAEDYRCKFALFDKETKPRKTVAQLCAIKLRKPFMRDLIEGRINRDELEWAMKWVDENFKFIRPPKGEFTVDDLLEKTDVLVKQFGIDGLVCDAWNNLSQRRPKGAEPYEYLAASLEKMNDFRESKNILLGIVVHPPKLEKNKRGGYDPPTPYEAMGGSHFFNKMDAMIAVHRNKLDQTVPVDVHIQKLRDEDMGIMGVAHPMYDPAIGLYFDGTNELGLPIYGESVIEATQRHKPMILKVRE